MQIMTRTLTDRIDVDFSGAWSTLFPGEGALAEEQRYF